MVVHADGHVVGGLLKGEWDLLKTSDVIVVVFYRSKAKLRYELGQIHLQAIELVDRQLPGLEPGFLLILDQLAHHQLFTQLLLIRHSSRIYLGQSSQKGAAARKGVVIGLHGEIRELIVVAVIADRGGELGVVLEVIFPDVGEDGVQGFHPAGERDSRRGARCALGGK